MNDLYGLMAEFGRGEELIAAARACRKDGYRRVDAFTPFPLEGLAEALELGRDGLSSLVLLGGLAGAAAGYGLQYYVSVVSYPINVGGRPLHSWPAFIPVTFELAILCAAAAAVLGMFALNGLPMPYHPVFNVERFALATKDRFFLLVEAADPRFSAPATRAFLERLGAKGVYDVEP